MINFFSISTIFIIISILISIESIIFMFTRHKTQQGKFIGFLLIGQSIELIFYLLQLVIELPKTIQIIYNFQVLGYTIFSLSWLLFVFAFTQNSKWISKKNLSIILALPLITITLLTIYWIQGPEIYSSRELIGSLFQSPFLCNYAKVLQIIYSNGIWLFSTFILVQFYLISDSTIRKVTFPLIIGPILLCFVGLIEIFRLNPVPSIPLFQISIASISLLTFIIIFNLRFRNVKSFARATVVGQMQDGVLVLDNRHRIIDLNTPAQKIINPKNKKILMERLTDVWPARAEKILSTQNDLPVEGEVTIEINGLESTFDFSNSQLMDEYHEKIGRVIVFHNVTGRERIEQALNERSTELERTNKILSALSEITVSIQSGSNQDHFLSILGAELRKLNIVCFIARLHPGTNELQISYISLDSERRLKVEQAIKNRIIGFRLSRHQFGPLYNIMDSKLISFEKYKEGDLGKDSGVISEKILGWAIRQLGLTSELAPVVLPLYTSENDIGVMGLWGKEILESDIPSFRIFASQVASALEKINEYENETHRSAELLRSNSLVTALAKVSSILQTTNNSEVVLDTLGKELMEIGLNCAVVTFDPKGETAFIKYLSFSPELINKIENLIGFNTQNYPIKKNLWPGDKIHTEKKPIWYSNPKEIFRKMFPKVPQTIGSTAFKWLGFGDADQLCILPLVSGEAVLGAMPIWGPNLKQADNPILSVFSSQVSSIIRNISDYEEEVKRANALAQSNAIIIALSNVALQLETTNNLTDVYGTIGRELKKISIQCMIGSIDDTKQFMKIEFLSIMADINPWIQKLDIFWPDEVIIPRKLWPTDKAITEKTPYWDPDPIGNTAKMFPYVPKNIFQKTFKQAGMSLNDPVCYLPMIIDEDVIGILAVWGPNIQIDDIPGLSIFANQVSTAMKNTRLYNQAQREIADRTEAEYKVRESLREKEILLKEVHHRVKNNLQVITSLLNLQIAQSPESIANEPLRESQNRVRAMALIHEKLYQSEDIGHINFSLYLQSLTSALEQTYRINPERVEIKVEAENIFLDLDTAIPCGLVVNELVSNSLKYAFPHKNRGHIMISCQKEENGKIILVVKDNGIGLPEDFSLKRTNSLGLKLVTNLVRQIDGTLVIDGKHGSRFEVAF